MKRKILLISVIFSIYGCNSSKIYNIKHTKENLKTPSENFQVKSYNSNNYLFSIKDKFLVINQLEKYTILKPENKNIYFAIDKKGKLTYRIVEKCENKFKFSPYSFVVYPSNVRFN